MFDESVTILENKKINGEFYKLVFSSSRLSKGVLPGQFLNIQIENHDGLFLRRPFSYYRVRENRIEILYEILGRGTALLAEKRPGHKLKALGPLGKPFTQKVKGKKHILVAGGVGVPPLVFLAETAPHLSSPHGSGGRKKVGGETIMLSEWPSPVLDSRFSGEASQVNQFREVVGGIRDLRSRLGLKPADRLPEVYVVVKSRQVSETLLRFRKEILAFGRVKELFLEENFKKQPGQ